MFHWLGGIDVELVRRTPDARPVKISAFACTVGKRMGGWRQLDRNEAVVGCLFNDGIYAVLYKGEFRVVSVDGHPPPQRGQKR